MSNTRPATLAEIKRHIANDRPENLKVTIAVGEGEEPITIQNSDTIKVGQVLRFCEAAARHNGTFLLHY